MFAIPGINSFLTLIILSRCTEILLSNFDFGRLGNVIGDSSNKFHWYGVKIDKCFEKDAQFMWNQHNEFFDLWNLEH